MSMYRNCSSKQKLSTACMSKDFLFFHWRIHCDWRGGEESWPSGRGHHAAWCCKPFLHLHELAASLCQHLWIHEGINDGLNCCSNTVYIPHWPLNKLNCSSKQRRSMSFLVFEHWGEWIYEECVWGQDWRSGCQVMTTCEVEVKLEVGKRESQRRKRWRHFLCGHRMERKFLWGSKG